MDSDKAYILGLLHDIGRRFGTRHLGHVYDGYKYMLNLGYDEVAKICLTHSFSVPDITTYIGNFDIAIDEQGEVAKALEQSVFDDYDRLIQLCDCIYRKVGDDFSGFSSLYNLYTKRDVLMLSFNLEQYNKLKYRV